MQTPDKISFLLKSKVTIEKQYSACYATKKRKESENLELVSMTKEEYSQMLKEYVSELDDESVDTLISTMSDCLHISNNLKDMPEEFRLYGYYDDFIRGCADDSVSSDYLEGVYVKLNEELIKRIGELKSHSDPS